ncbi:GDSL-type esterase/lipase family protein [Burkholderia cepacia]|uniref:SGNH/GDSL hydrolase family protein n=1 Tax=Burkholderia cepacia TaxID=292 RepID=UPI001CF25C38|nr:SGNH/GDSL hydrolase family protein [Burkholderia cepacia]MCA8214478.1 GDSL-type esterase/lipase family protein [Burkholderia cepacia]
MTVNSSDLQVAYDGDNSTTQFPIPFYFLRDEDIYVALSKDGVGTDLVLGTDYSLTGAGNEGGGTLQMYVAPSSAYQIQIQRNVAVTQQSQYQQNDPFPSKTTERALDKLTMICQQLTLLLGGGEPGLSRALMLGKFDVNGRGAYRANNNRIQDLADPIGGQDAVNLRYLNQQLANLLVDGAGQRVLDLLAAPDGNALIGKSAADQLITYISARMAAGETVNIACYGDSTTDGLNTTGWVANPVTPGNVPVGNSDHEATAPNAWPARLKALLREMFSNNHIQVWNAGYSGQRLDTGWALQNYDIAVTNNPFYGRPDLCFIAFGLNDIFGPGEAFVRHYQQTKLLVRKLLANGTIPVLLTCDANYNNDPSQRDHKVISRQVDQAKWAVAVEYGIPIIDMNREMERWLNENPDGYRWGDEQPDGVHFGDHGHGFKATVAAKYLFKDLLFIEQGKNTRLVTMDSRAAYGFGAANVNAAYIQQGKNPFFGNNAPANAPVLTAWVWNGSPDTELIYRGIGGEGPQAGTVMPFIRVSERIQNFSASRRIPAASNAVAENNEGLHRKSDIPYRVRKLWYGLNKVEYVNGDRTGLYFGGFEFWQTAPTWAANNALKNVGVFQQPVTAGQNRVEFMPEFKDGSNVVSVMEGDTAAIMLDVTLPVATGVVFAYTTGWRGDGGYGDIAFSFLYRTAANTLELYQGYRYQSTGTIITTAALGASSAITWTNDRAKLRIEITKSGVQQIVRVFEGYTYANAPILTVTRNTSDTLLHYAGAVGGLWLAGAFGASGWASINDAFVQLVQAAS